jgi:hypothetical protein
MSDYVIIILAIFFWVLGVILFKKPEDILVKVVKFLNKCFTDKG